VRLKPSKYSIITEYISKFNHSFDWENVKILDSESSYNKKLISTQLMMLYIKEQNRDINSQKNTQFLDDSYFYLLDTISNLI